MLHYFRMFSHVHLRNKKTKMMRLIKKEKNIKTFKYFIKDCLFVSIYLYKFKIGIEWRKNYENIKLCNCKIIIEVY